MRRLPQLRCLISCGNAIFDGLTITKVCEVLKYFDFMYRMDIRTSEEAI